VGSVISFIPERIVLTTAVTAFGRSGGLPLHDQQPPFSALAVAPDRAPSGIAKASTSTVTPDSFLIDEGVMPQTRPDVISDAVSLSDKEGREVRTLVAEEGAFDAFLSVPPVLCAPPNKGSVSTS
jgi:hypothetical protein